MAIELKYVYIIIFSCIITVFIGITVSSLVVSAVSSSQSVYNTPLEYSQSTSEGCCSMIGCSMIVPILFIIAFIFAILIGFIYDLILYLIDITNIIFNKLLEFLCYIIIFIVCLTSWYIYLKR